MHDKQKKITKISFPPKKRKRSVQKICNYYIGNTNQFLNSNLYNCISLPPNVKQIAIKALKLLDAKEIERNGTCRTNRYF